MQFEIRITSKDQNFSINQAKSLKRWLIEEENKNFQVSQKQKKMGEDEAGGGSLIEILTVILGTPTLVVLATSLTTWIKQKASIIEAKKNCLKIQINNKEGEKLIFEISDVEKMDEELFNSILKLSHKNSNE